MNTKPVYVLLTTDEQKKLIESIFVDSNFKPQYVCDKHELRKQCEYSNIIIVHVRSNACPLPDVQQWRNAARVIVLSDRQDEDAVVKVLRDGAHHYFNLNETCMLLKVRIEAALRQHINQPLEFAPYRFHPMSREIQLNGHSIRLNPREYDCAYYLFNNRHRIVTKEELMVSVWALPAHLDTRRIDTAASKMKRKLKLNSREIGWYLHRIRNVGYQLSKSEQMN